MPELLPLLHNEKSIFELDGLPETGVELHLTALVRGTDVYDAS